MALVMERPGFADGKSIRIKKTIELVAGSRELAVHYELSDMPPEACLHFAVELNLAALAGHAEDRYYTDSLGARLGMLDSQLDLSHTQGVSLTDEWLDLVAGLSWSKPGDSGATLSRPSARARGVSRPFISRRPSSPTGTRPPTRPAAGTCRFASHSKPSIQLRRPSTGTENAWPRCETPITAFPSSAT